MFKYAGKSEGSDVMVTEPAKDSVGGERTLKFPDKPADIAAFAY